MKREIKFRGQDIATGKWVYGSLAVDDYGNCQIIEFADHHEQWHNVDPETVGQYTDVEDNNGVEIYEGDIIRHGELFEICFEDGCFWRRNESDTMELHTILGMGKIEVVGNIYDNTELVKNL